jgi:hypothetical protein
MGFNYREGKYHKYNKEILELMQTKMSDAAIARMLIDKHDIKVETDASFANYVWHLKQKYRDYDQYKNELIETDKKMAEFNWRDALIPMQQLQNMADRASGAQDKANWKIKINRPICVAFIADLQLGSWGTDYELFKQVTDEILHTEDLYVILGGDLLQMAVKMRNVLEMKDDLLPPKFQFYFLDSWLNEIKHKVIASVWDNHSVMREEAVLGYSNYAEMFKRHTIYHNGIGHLDIEVNNITYKWAITHFFRGKSMYNKAHAPMRYLRMEANDRDIAAQGDFHDPGINIYNEGGNQRIAMVCGSIQTNSGYAKRFFSLHTAPVYPCIVLHPDQKIMTPFWSIKEWLKTRNENRPEQINHGATTAAHKTKRVKTKRSPGRIKKKNIRISKKARKV